MVEGNVFTSPAVAGILQEKFVEARLHLETYSNAGGAKWDAFVAIRDQYASSPAMPTYAVVRPSDRAQLGWHQLQGGPTAWTKEILDFLKGAIAEAQR